jgi:hypothetical protein
LTPLHTCRLPPARLFEPTAIELCARQVASTTGDLRLAIKACRSALDALAAARAQHFEAAAASADAAAADDGCGGRDQGGGGSKAPPACVGARDMMAALGRLAGRGSRVGAKSRWCCRCFA